MQKTDEKPDLSFTQNRELSWLNFDRRVLEEAADPTVPLIERLRFISIFTSNLDEFFMVRVGGLFNLELLSPKARDNKSGLTAREQLDRIFTRVRELLVLRDDIYAALRPELEANGVCEGDLKKLDKKSIQFLNEYFTQNIKPLLSPQIIDLSHPFPHLKNKALYIGALLTHGKHELLGLIDLPESVPSLIWLPGPSRVFVRTENLLLQMAEKLFPLYSIREKAVLSVTRNADIDYGSDEDFPDLRSKMSTLLRRRDRLAPVRLELSADVRRLSALLRRQLELSESQVFVCRCPLRLDWAYQLNDYPMHLYNMPRAPQYPAYLDERRSMIAQIRQKDRLLFYPYDSMQPFHDLLREAAHDPAVQSIRITIYRLAKNSLLVHHLCEAAENGKEVTVLMELRARFDEKPNIEWAGVLEEAGCRILYGPENLKCHAKLCLITRRERGGEIQYITQVGTGNYNEKTAALYTDFSLLTANPAIGREAADFFRNIQTGNFYGSYQKLLVAPASMREPLLRLIDDEIRRGPKGRIILKINSLTERDMIDKLCQASQAGVSIDLIVRGICCLLPGIPGKTENIRVTSIVGRYLEHSRVYAFGRGDTARVYIASADWMTRNQRRRIEVGCPIEDPDIRRWLCSYLDILLADTRKARLMTPMGTYVKKASGDGQEIHSQLYFSQNPPQFPAAPVRTGLLDRLRARFRPAQ
ncbi:MAG: polyphosphate kinase 1 [Butyricicoccaceae bacterium]